MMALQTRPCSSGATTSGQSNIALVHPLQLQAAAASGAGGAGSPVFGTPLQPSASILPAAGANTVPLSVNTTLINNRLHSAVSVNLNGVVKSVLVPSVTGYRLQISHEPAIQPIAWRSQSQPQTQTPQPGVWLSQDQTQPTTSLPEPQAHSRVLFSQSLTQPRAWLSQTQTQPRASPTESQPRVCIPQPCGSNCALNMANPAVRSVIFRVRHPNPPTGTPGVVPASPVPQPECRQFITPSSYQVRTTSNLSEPKFNVDCNGNVTEKADTISEWPTQLETFVQQQTSQLATDIFPLLDGIGTKGTDTCATQGLSLKASSPTLKIDSVFSLSKERSPIVIEPQNDMVTCTDDQEKFPNASGEVVRGDMHQVMIADEIRKQIAEVRENEIGGVQENIAYINLDDSPVKEKVTKKTARKNRGSDAKSRKRQKPKRSSVNAESVSQRIRGIKRSATHDSSPRKRSKLTDSPRVEPTPVNFDVTTDDNVDAAVSGSPIKTINGETSMPSSVDEIKEPNSVGLTLPILTLPITPLTGSTMSTSNGNLPTKRPVPILPAPPGEKSSGIIIGGATNAKQTARGEKRKHLLINTSAGCFLIPMENHHAAEECKSNLTLANEMQTINFAIQNDTAKQGATVDVVSNPKESPSSEEIPKPTPSHLQSVTVENSLSEKSHQLPDGSRCTTKKETTQERIRRLKMEILLKEEELIDVKMKRLETRKLLLDLE